MLVLVKLRQIRERKGLSQRDLAERSGVAQATISNLEKGRPSRFVTMRALATALEVDTVELVGDRRRLPAPRHTPRRPCQPSAHLAMDRSKTPTWTSSRDSGWCDLPPMRRTLIEQDRSS